MIYSAEVTQRLTRQSVRDSDLFRGHRRKPGLLLAWVGLLPALRYDFGQMINLVMSNFGSCPPAVRADGFTSCPPHLTLGLLFQGSASRRAQSQCHRWLQGGFVCTFQKAGEKTAVPRPLQVARVGLFPFVVSHGELCSVEAWWHLLPQLFSTWGSRPLWGPNNSFT